MPTLKADDVMVLMWLVMLATNKQTKTYKEMAEQFGGLPVGMGVPLSRIANYCHSKSLPLLSVLIVSKDTGLPSDPRFYSDLGVDDLEAEIKNCFEFDWSNIGKMRK